MTTNNGLSRINDAMNEGAIAPPPSSGGGRLKRGKKAQPLNVPAPEVVEPQEEFKALQSEVLNSVAGQLTEVVTTTDQMIDKMERGAAEYLIERVNGSAPRVAATIQQKVGGVNNAAGFRADAESIANAFLSSLGATATD